MTAPDTLARCICLAEQEWPEHAGAIEAGTVLAELGLDSLEQMILVVNAEQEFRVAIPDHALSGINRPEDLARAVDAALEQRRAMA